MPFALTVAMALLVMFVPACGGSGDSTVGDMSVAGDANTSADASNDVGGPGCGDGQIDDGEQCDEDNLGGFDCNSLGFDDGTLRCTECSFDTELCNVDDGGGGGGMDCGNGTIDSGEQCDGANLNGATCESQGHGPGVLMCVLCSYDTSFCDL